MLGHELYRRFPELLAAVSPTDPDLPYAVMIEFVHWLSNHSRPGDSPELVRRVTEFHDWCMEQPPGMDASDDPLTIVVIGLYETIISMEGARPWITCLISKEELLDIRDGLIPWVGQRAFDLALAAYD